ncbi:MAG: RluA family pseudouridine synthase [bacterium]|nr:RluA family pseudouridine synthase [bacterium]
MNLNILYEDANLLVVDKVAGIDIEGIQKLLPEGFSPAHRLDKDTSGALLIAKDPKTLEFLQNQFQERTIEKKYVCLVEGGVKEGGKIEALLGRSRQDRRKQKVFLPGEPGAEGRSFGASLAHQKWAGKREASTEYRVLKRYQGYSFLEASPKTGRKHQIRVHMSYLGHPIAGDKLYGFKDQRMPEGLKRQFLHAASLIFTLPGGEQKTVESPLPEDLKSVLANLKTL